MKKRIWLCAFLTSALLFSGCQEDNAPLDSDAVSDSGTAAVTVTDTVSLDSTADTVVFTPYYTFDFTSEEDLSGLYSEHHMEHRETADGVVFTARGNDPIIHLPCPTGNTGKLAYAAIVYKTDLSGIRGEFYAARADGVNMGDLGSHVDWTWGDDSHADGEWTVEVVDLYAWSGDSTTLTALRIDPMAGSLSDGDEITLRAIAFFETEEEARAFTLSAYEEQQAALTAQKEAEKAAQLAALQRDWAVPEYKEIDISTRDNTSGTLSYTTSADGETVVISYQLNGETVSYTVPNNVEYLAGPYAATDDLGRSLYTEEDKILLYENDTETHTVGALGDHGEHDVGIFYFLWMGEHGDPGILDMEKILANKGSDDPDYEGWGDVGAFHFFAEPLYGYYYSSDTWVIRKHMELLTAAGVDFLYFDVTNAYTYLDNALAVMKVCHSMNEQGFDAPEVVFYTNTNAEAVVQELYDNIYAKNLYPDTWYILDGKPLIIAPKKTNVDDFFTLRYNQWPTEATKRGGWPWMDFELEQRIFKNPSGIADTISVSVAQHSGTVCFSDSRIYGDTTNRGRSYLSYYVGTEYRGTYEKLSEDSYLWGYNSGSQFARAIKENVPYVLVTGWNEWIAQRQNPDMGGRSDRVNFVDTCGVEYSRDIEMTRGYYFDNYYMQLASNIQALDGAVPDVVQDMRKTINVTGDFDQWDDVIVTYTDMQGDNQDRDSLGYGQTRYTDTTGRNDIVKAKITSDNTSLYFYVQTAAPITTFDNESTWMQLYLNTDGDTTGWYGYDYLIADTVKDDFTLTAVRFTGSERTETENAGEVSMRVSGNEMMVEVPLSLLGIPDYKEISIEFKWADSTTVIDEMEDFYCEGDAAPLGRLNWVYRNYK